MPLKWDVLKAAKIFSHSSQWICFALSVHVPLFSFFNQLPITVPSLCEDLCIVLLSKSNYIKLMKSWWFQGELNTPFYLDWCPHHLHIHTAHTLDGNTVRATHWHNCKWLCYSLLGRMKPATVLCMPSLKGNEMSSSEFHKTNLSKRGGSNNNSSRYKSSS